MKKTLSIITLAAILSGCATPQQVSAPVQKDKEPIIVGVPIQDRLAQSSKQIYEQLDLLNKIKAGKFIGEYEMVEHNNQVDARKGSKQTVPKAYAFKEEIKAQEKRTQALMAERERVLAVLNTQVKNIEWNDNSANELAKHFAITLGYELAVTPNLKDRKITFSVRDVTVLEAIQKFQQIMLPYADIFVIDQNKTFNVVYK